MGIQRLSIVRRSVSCACAARRVLRVFLGDTLFKSPAAFSILLRAFSIPVVSSRRGEKSSSGHSGRGGGGPIPDQGTVSTRNIPQLAVLLLAFSQATTSCGV